MYADVGAGTGDLASLLCTACPAATVLAVDASQAMLRAARIPLQAAIVGDAQRLPLRDGSLDGAVSGFLLRNLQSLDAFFAAASRAVRPGGRLVVLEIALPRRRAPRLLFQAWFHGVAPLLGAAASGRAGAYRYLARSLRGFPDPESLARMAEGAGWTRCGLERSGWLGLFVLTLTRGDGPAEGVPAEKMANAGSA